MELSLIFQKQINVEALFSQSGQTKKQNSRPSSADIFKLIPGAGGDSNTANCDKKHPAAKRNVSRAMSLSLNCMGGSNQPVINGAISVEELESPSLNGQSFRNRIHSMCESSAPLLPTVEESAIHKLFSKQPQHDLHQGQHGRGESPEPGSKTAAATRKKNNKILQRNNPPIAAAQHVGNPLELPVKSSSFGYLDSSMPHQGGQDAASKRTSAPINVPLSVPAQNNGILGLQHRSSNAGQSDNMPTIPLDPLLMQSAVTTTTAGYGNSGLVSPANFLFPHDFHQSKSSPNLTSFSYTSKCTILIT